MKIMYVWMGVDPRTGRQSFGNTTVTVPAGSKYRTEAAMDRMSELIQEENQLVHPAAILNVIELDQEPGRVPAVVRKALTEALIGSPVDGDPWFPAGPYSARDNRDGTFLVEDEGTFRLTLNIERVEDES
jgi:hypothetical protein